VEQVMFPELKTKAANIWARHCREDISVKSSNCDRKIKTVAVKWAFQEP